MSNEEPLSAEEASDNARRQIENAISQRRWFLVKAGAGAGKTYSLIQALNYILAHKAVYLPRADQQIACITYTNVAVDEIRTRTDRDPQIFAATVHSFLWEAIRPFQRYLIDLVRSLEAWRNRYPELANTRITDVTYDLGFREIQDGRLSLHHDDIPALASALFAYPKFRALLVDRYPVLFIDEYQDTPAQLLASLLNSFEGDARRPIIGLFGDDWQQIYNNTCGPIKRDSILEIYKHGNFRSGKAVLDLLNKIRPDLRQVPKLAAPNGSVSIYHTNLFPPNLREPSGHFKGLLREDVIARCRKWVENKSGSSEWIQTSADYKVLMLTHRAIASELGYGSLHAKIKPKELFLNKEHPVIQYLLDCLEPAMECFSCKNYGQMIERLDVIGTEQQSGVRRTKFTRILSPRHKRELFKVVGTLVSLSKSGSVGDVLDLLFQQNVLYLPESVRVFGEVHEHHNSTPVVSQHLLKNYHSLRAVAYQEIRQLYRFLGLSTPLATQHSVKGAEFDDVLVIFGRWWNQYNFPWFLEQCSKSDVGNADKKFDKNRNLFYVSLSRAKCHLALLFVDELSDNALTHLSNLVGSANVIAVRLDDNNAEIGTS